MNFLRPSGPRNKTCDKDFPLEQHSPYNNDVVSSQHFIYYNLYMPRKILNLFFPLRQKCEIIKYQQKSALVVLCTI